MAETFAVTGQNPVKYRYVKVYEVRGLNHPPGTGDLEIYREEGDVTVRALLTDKLDDYCYEVDRAQAVAYTMLRGMVGQRESNDFKAEVETEIDRIRERRNKEFDLSETLVFLAEGEAQVDLSRPNRETEDYILGFRLLDKDRIVKSHSDQVSAALAALCLSPGCESIEYKRMQAGIYLLNESGKSIYSLEFGGSADAWGSRRTTDETIGRARKQATILASTPSLARVCKLLVQAVSRDNDDLRRFMFGWFGLEILINKVFSDYEKLFVQNLVGADPANPIRRYFERIRDVMRGKYTIADKFIVVAACVGDASVEGDIEDFLRVKERRDALLHGEPIDEKSLPISKTVELLKKYIRVHTNTKTC